MRNKINFKEIALLKKLGNFNLITIFQKISEDEFNKNGELKCDRFYKEAFLTRVKITFDEALKVPVHVAESQREKIDSRIEKLENLYMCQRTFHGTKNHWSYLTKIKIRELTYKDLTMLVAVLLLDFERENMQSLREDLINHFNDKLIC